MAEQLPTEAVTDAELADLIDRCDIDAKSYAEQAESSPTPHIEEEWARIARLEWSALRELQRLRSPHGASAESPQWDFNQFIGFLSARIPGLSIITLHRLLQEYKPLRQPPSSGEPSESSTRHAAAIFTARPSNEGPEAAAAGPGTPHEPSAPSTNSVPVSSKSASPGEPSEKLYTAKDVEALFAIRDAAVAAHANKPVATAWMKNGVMDNAFPYPPKTPEEWAEHDSDGYWAKKGYSQKPLYFAPPPSPEPGAVPGAWMVTFEDRDFGTAVWTGPNAEGSARRAYSNASTTKACRLWRCVEQAGYGPPETKSAKP